MNEQSGSNQKDPDLFGFVNDTYNYIFTNENILKQLYFKQIIL